MKKKFRFRLEPVEKIRKAREQDALRALGHAQAKYHEAVQMKKRLLDQTMESLERRERLAEAPQSILAYRLESEFIVGQKQRIVKSDQWILRQRKLVDKALREYLQAKRQLRAIELLREKAFAQWKLEAKKKEQKETEDLYVMRAARMKRDDDEAGFREMA